MSLLASLAHRLTFISSSTAFALLAAGSIAGLLAAYLCQSGHTPSLEPVDFPVAALCRTFLTFGLANFLTLLTAASFLIFSRSWPGTVPSENSEAAAQTESPGAFVLTILLTILPIAAIWSLLPASGLVLANSDVWNDPVGGFAMMAPLHQVVTIAVLALADIAMLMSFLARSRHFQRAAVAAAVVCLGFLVSCTTVLQLTELLAEALRVPSELIQDYQSAIATGVRNLQWLSAAHIMTAAIALLRTESETPASPQVAISHPDPFPNTLPVASPKVLPMDAGPFSSDRYFVRARYLGWPFGGRLTIDDLEAVRTYVAKIVPFELRKNILITSEDGVQSQLVRITARQVLPIGCWYDVIDGTTGEKIAAVQKKWGQHWLLHDPQDRPVGVLKEKRSSIGIGEYAAVAGDHELATFSWNTVLRPAVGISFAPNQQAFDRRTGIALGVLLFIDLSVGSG